MWFPLFISKRYLFSRKNTNAINIISGIAVAVFTVGTAVMIIILSFLNGLEGLVKDLNNSFDPEIKITAKHSKSFNPKLIFDKLSDLEGIEVISKTLEDNVVVRYGEAQEIARVKGVDDNFYLLTNMDTLLLSGSFDLNSESGKNKAVFGGALSSSLNINTDNIIRSAALFVPAKGVEYNQLNPEASLNSTYVIPTGVIMLTEESDKDLILVSLQTAQELFQRDTMISALEIAIEPNSDIESLQQSIQKTVGANYQVLNRDQQNESAYRVFTTEKWATFAILSLVLMIAAFNTIGALTMLVIEKSKDIRILKSLGANSKVIQRIFLSEGLMITILGIIIGGIVGIAFIWMQENFGIIRLEGSFVEYFPIELRYGDLVKICSIILSLGLLASIYPALRSAKDGYAD
jgi:lipoprotein-releasing system permease protein